MTIILLWIVSAIAAVGGTVLTALPSRTWHQRGIAVCAFLLIVFAAFTLAPSMLSRPKPVDLEWSMRNVSTAQVIGSLPVEGTAIYLLLRLPEIAEPRYYMLPWSMKTAQQLQDAIRNAKPGEHVMMGMPFQPSLDSGEPKFYALPQPMLPPKAGESPPVALPGGGA